MPNQTTPKSNLYCAAADFHHAPFVSTKVITYDCRGPRTYKRTDRKNEKQLYTTENQCRGFIYKEKAGNDDA